MEKTVKKTVSMPEDVFSAAEETAKRLGISRSRLYADAVRQYVRDQEREDLTENYDRVCAELETAMDPVLAKMQEQALPHDEWTNDEWSND
jgi:metal-responsive CopG/Arc/MetJ family transcriptional regulator